MPRQRPGGSGSRRTPAPPRHRPASRASWSLRCRPEQRSWPSSSSPASSPGSSGTVSSLALVAAAAAPPGGRLRRDLPARPGGGPVSPGLGRPGRIAPVRRRVGAHGMRGAPSARRLDLVGDGGKLDSLRDSIAERLDITPQARPRGSCGQDHATRLRRREAGRGGGGRPRRRWARSDRSRQAGAGSCARARRVWFRGPGRLGGADRTAAP